MTVKAYVDATNGKTLYRARVTRVSSINSKIVVDKVLTGFKTQAEAEKADRRLLIDVERELRITEAKGSQWRTLIEEWEVAARRGDIFIREIGKQTVDDYVFIVRDRTRDWMDLHISEIDRARAWLTLDRADREISVSRRKRLRTAIDAIFRWAMLSGRITGISVVPTEGFHSLKKEVEKLPEILTLEQIRTLLSYADTVSHPWYPIWAVALCTGMRSGELYALQWDQIDFDNKLIFVHRNWTNREGFGPTKGRYWRTVPIESSQVLTLFKSLKSKSDGRSFVLPHFNLWSKGEAAKVLREFCVGSGLPSIKFHTLRACFATQLIRDAVAPAVVMKICGWKDLKTMQRYIRLAGLDVKGATVSLKLLPEREVMGRVVSLFKQDS